MVVSRKKICMFQDRKLCLGILSVNDSTNGSGEINILRNRLMLSLFL